MDTLAQKLFRQGFENVRPDNTGHDWDVILMAADRLDDLGDHDHATAIRLFVDRHRNPEQAHG